MALLSAGAGAHNYWLRGIPTGVQVCIGDVDDSESYQRSSLPSVAAFDQEGKPLPLQEEFRDGRLTLLCPQAAAFAIHADYGTWIKTIRGWKRGTKGQDSRDRVLKSAWHVQYAKWVRRQHGTLHLGQPLEIVLSAVGPGEVRGTVQSGGRPLADRPIYRGHDRLCKSDASGQFVIAHQTSSEALVISTDLEEELHENPDADKKIITASLTLAP